MTDLLDSPEAGGRVVRGGALRIAGFGAATLLSLAGIVLLTRHLGAGEFGRFQTVLSITTVIATVTDLGMTTLAIREWAQRPGPERDRLLRALLGLRLALTAIGIVIGAVAVAVGDGTGALLAGVLLMGAGTALLVLQTTLQVPLGATLRLGAIAGVDVARSALTTAGFALVVVLDGDLVGACAVLLPVNAVLLLVTARLVRGEIGLRPSFERDEWVALLKPAAAFALATAVGIVYLYAAQLVVAVVTGDEETGHFSAAFRVFVIVAQVPAILLTSAFPVLARAARDDPARLANVVAGVSRASVLIGGAACVVLVLGAGPIIDVMAGRPEYAGSVGVLQVLGGVLLVTFLLATWGYTLLALHRHRAMVWANVAALTVVLTAVAVLAAAGGGHAAAWGLLAGEATLAAGYAIALRNVDLRPLAKVLVAVGAGLAVGLTGLPDVAAVLFGLVAYTAVAFAVRAVPADLKHLVRP